MASIFRGKPVYIVDPVTGAPANPVYLTDVNGDPAFGSIGRPQGRLRPNTPSNINMATGDVAAATTIFYTPYFGQFAPVWTGSSFQMIDFGGELTNVLANSSVGSAGPAATVLNSNYDVFLWLNAGVPTLTRGPAWTADGTRGTGAGTTEIGYLQGFLVNLNDIVNGPAANFGLYLGTFRTDGSGTLTYHRGGAVAGGTAALLTVWNMYNRLVTSALVTDTTTGWTYTSNTIAPLNASVGNRVSFISGVGGDGYNALLQCNMQTPAVTASFARTGLGLNATNLQTRFSMVTATSNLVTQVPSTTYYRGFSITGWHFLQATERADGTNAVTLGTGANTTLSFEFMM